MDTVKDKRSLFLLNVLLFLTFDLMLLGAGVRTMDAGLTCPDWPLCFGKVVPEYHFGVYLEFIHRVIAGFVAIIFAVLFFKWIKDSSKAHLKFQLWLALFLLIAQIVMGGLTVLKLLDFVIVTMHLSLATAFLLTIASIKHSLNKPTEKGSLSPKKWVRRLQVGTLGIMGLVCVQIVLGGLVASTYSGMICVDFPTCNGEWFPALQGAVGVQMLHRFGAYTLTVLMTVLFFAVVFRSKEMGLTKKLRAGYIEIFCLLWMQVAVGVMNLKWLIPAWLSVVHLGLALLILLGLLRSYFQYNSLIRKAH